MSTFYAIYPPSAAAGANASVGPNGSPAPTSSTEVGGINPSGNLQPLQTDAIGNLLVSLASDPAMPYHVIVDSSALPTGASTSALQTSGNASLTSIDTKLTAPLAVTGPLTDAQLRASPVPVDGSGSIQPVSGTVTVVQPTGTNLHAVIDSSALPSGAATAANQVTEIASLASIDTKLTSPLTVTGPLTNVQLRASPVPVDGSGAVQPVSGTVTVTQATGTNLHAVIDASALPTGASTAANQATEIASLASIDSKLTSPLAVTGPLTDTQLRASAVPVSAASLPLPTGAATAANQVTEIASLASIDTKLTAPLAVNQQGRSIANAPVRNDYTSVNVTTAAYVQLVASSTSATSEIEIFDSSGQTLFLAVGAAASEVNQILIFPGGNGRVPLKIPAGTRISIKAVSATANTGEIDINFYV